MSVAYSDVPKPETNPTDLLTSAEHNAAPPLVPIDAPSAVQRPWENDQPEEISASFTCEQHRWASGENQTEESAARRVMSTACGSLGGTKRLILTTSPEASMDFNKSGFGRSAKLITGTAIIIVAFGGISYFLFASESLRSSPPQTTASLSRSEPAAPIPSITSVPPSDPPSSRTAAPPPSSLPESQTTPPPATVWPLPSAQAPPISWPDPPALVQVSPRPSPVGPRDPNALSRSTTDSVAARQPALGSQSSPYVFLQRPGVNVRSTPSLTGSVVGSLPKGTRIEVLERSGEWAQVKSGSLKGWINARFSGPNAP